METLNVEKLVNYLEQNKDKTTNWFIKFAGDIRKQMKDSRPVTIKQVLVLFEEVRRIFFINNISKFE